MIKNNHNYNFNKQNKSKMTDMDQQSHVDND